MSFFSVCFLKRYNLVVWNNSKVRRSFMQRIPVICFFLFAAAGIVSCAEKSQIIPIQIERKKTSDLVSLTVETAISAQEQQRGFMYRKNISDGTGMLFIYSRDSQLRFWMKDTPHPLSIAFIDSSGRIREMYDMQPFSLEIISSVHSVRYALEVPQGYFRRAGVGIGDALSKESLERLATL